MAVQVLKAGAVFRRGLEPEVDCPGALSAVWYSWQLYPAAACLPQRATPRQQCHVHKHGYTH